MITQASIEQSLRPSEAHALDLIRQAGAKGLNRYEATALGHGSLSQRVSALQDKGFLFSHTPETWIDPAGNPHSGVMRYHYLGWQAFTPPTPSNPQEARL